MHDESSQDRGDPPPISLVLLSPADAAALQQVYKGASDTFLATTGAPARPDQATNDLEQAATDDARYLLGVFLQEQLVGVIDFRLAEPEPFAVRLGLIMLSQPYRRQHLGTWALHIFEEWLRQSTPSEAIMATVQAQDYAAQAFLRHQGYAFNGQAIRIGREPAGSSRLLWMRKDL